MGFSCPWNFAQGGAPVRWTHDCDILFGFVMEGAVTLAAADQTPHRLEPGDACVIPPDMAVELSAPTTEFEMLEVALPGAFQTHLLTD